MQIKKQISNKIWIIILIILIIGILSLLGYLYTSKSWTFNSGKSSSTNSKQSNEELQQQKTTELNRKKEFIESNSKKDSPEPKPAAIPESSDSIILTVNKKAESVDIIVKLLGYASGKCSLNIVNGGSKFNQDTDILYQSEFSTCAGFTIPVSELGKGKWLISLTATPSGGKPITKTMEQNI